MSSNTRFSSLEEKVEQEPSTESSSSRPRRLRQTSYLRDLISETQSFDAAHIVVPMFVREGTRISEEIPSMPGVMRFSPDEALLAEVEKLRGLGVRALLLFGLPKKKDNMGSESWKKTGVIQQAVRNLTGVFPDLIVMCDVCLCEYTEHGHCGFLDKDGKVENDKSLEILGKIATSQAEAGADVVAPSAMMDNQVFAIRHALDLESFQDTAIMSYSAKYASAFYGPFREAAASAPSFGDRTTYQMDPRNLREALRETEIDIEQGADITMVKPAMPYLDVIRAVKQRFDLPLAAYQVSGEYAMIKAASLNGWIDEKRSVRESFTAIKRAGADILISYFAKQYLEEYWKDRETGN